MEVIVVQHYPIADIKVFWHFPFLLDLHYFVWNNLSVIVANWLTLKEILCISIEFWQNYTKKIYSFHPLRLLYVLWLIKEINDFHCSTIRTECKNKNFQGQLYCFSRMVLHSSKQNLIASESNSKINFDFHTELIAVSKTNFEFTHLI